MLTAAEVPDNGVVLIVIGCVIIIPIINRYKNIWIQHSNGYVDMAYSYH